MADEITISLSINVDKGGYNQTFGTNNLQVDMTGDYVVAPIQNIGTSAEALYKGDITTCGYVYAKNLDATNFVEIGYDDTGFKNVIKLKPGEANIFRLGQNTPQAKADTAAVDLMYVIIED